LHEKAPQKNPQTPPSRAVFAICLRRDPSETAGFLIFLVFLRLKKGPTTTEKSKLTKYYTFVLYDGCQFG
jgi:hypothetical protein